LSEIIIFDGFGQVVLEVFEAFMPLLVIFLVFKSMKRFIRNVSEK